MTANPNAEASEPTAPLPEPTADELLAAARKVAIRGVMVNNAKHHTKAAVVALTAAEQAFRDARTDLSDLINRVKPGMASGGMISPATMTLAVDPTQVEAWLAAFKERS